MINNIVHIQSRCARPTCPDFSYTTNIQYKKSMRAQNDWSVRLSREFQCSQMCVYFTLTFDDEHLPHYVYNGIDYDCTCWCNEHVSEDVFRTLRQKFGYKFRYVVFAEVGSDDYYYDEHGTMRQGTNRPHYHGLLFLDFEYDLSNLRDRMFKLWGNCIEKCFDFVRITDDQGFTKYVSKYVAKGIDKEHFSAKLLDRIAFVRRSLKEMSFMSCAELKPLRYQFEKYKKELSFYEQHRPKVLCSNGIGSSIPYTEAELVKGTIQQFDGKKVKEVPLPATVMRSKLYNVSRGTKKQCWKYKDGKVTWYDEDVVMTKYDWSLNDLGRRHYHYVLEHTLFRQHANDSLALHLQGTPTFACQSYFQSLDVEPITDYTSTASYLLQLYKSFDIKEIDCYRNLLSKYSYVRFCDLTGIDLNCDGAYEYVVEHWKSIYHDLIDMSSEISTAYGPSCHVPMSQYVPRLTLVADLCDQIDLLLETKRYDEYLQRLDLRQKSKRAKRQLINSKLQK